MKVVNFGQRTSEWLEWRRKGVGASDIAAILGYCPNRCPLDVYREKILNIIPEINADMQRGIDFEPVARSIFEEEVGHKYEPLCVEHYSNPLYKASLDGFNHEYREILEIKIPRPHRFYNMQKGSIPQTYLIQMQWQMFVTGAKKGYLMIFNPDTREMVIELVEYDNVFIETHLPKIDAFLQSLQDKRPPVNSHPKYESVNDADLHALFMDYMETKREIALLEAKLNAKKEEVIKRCGSENVVCGNFKLQKKEISRVDYKIACLDNGINMDRYKKSTTLTWTILEKKDK